MRKYWYDLKEGMIVKGVFTVFGETVLTEPFIVIVPPSHTGNSGKLKMRICYVSSNIDETTEVISDFIATTVYVLA